jgi:hypothetical protein
MMSLLSKIDSIKLNAFNARKRGPRLQIDTSVDIIPLSSPKRLGSINLDFSKRKQIAPGRFVYV